MCFKNALMVILGRTRVVIVLGSPPGSAAAYTRCFYLGANWN